MSWTQTKARLTFIDLYGAAAVGLNADGQLFYTDDIAKGRWTAKGGEYRFSHVSLFGTQCVGVRTNNELVRSRDIRSQGFGHVPFRNYRFTKVFLCGDPSNPNLAIGIRDSGEVVRTTDLNRAYWGHMPGNPRLVDLDIYGVGVVGVAANGDTYYSSNYNAGVWVRSDMKFTQVQLYGVSVSGIDAKGTMFVTDDITKGQWRQIPFPTQRGAQLALRQISMWSHQMAAVGPDDYVWISNKPDLGKIIGDLAAMIGRLNVEKAQLEQTVSEKGNVITGIESNIQGVTAEIQTLEAQAANQTAQADALDSQIRMLVDERNSLQAQLYNAQREIASLQSDLEQRDRRIVALNQEIAYWKKNFQDVSERCPVIPHGQVIADKASGVLYKVSQTENGTTLRAFPSVDVYKAFGSPTYTVFEAYQLKNCAQGPPLKIEEADQRAVTPTYLPPPNLHPPSKVIILSAKLWMDRQILKAVHLSEEHARPFLGSTLNDNSVFDVDPKTGSITSTSGKSLTLMTTSDRKETGWNFVPYKLRPLGTGIAFQLQQYNKKLAVIPGIDVTTLHSADSYSLDTVWFILGV